MTDARKVDRLRYRKVTTAMWTDDKFRELSSPPPNGQTLWTWFLTGPMTLPLPGVLRVGLAGISENLRWPLGATRRCWVEIETRQMAKADWAVLLVWLPRAIEHNTPESPNVVTAWRVVFNELPDCALRDEIERGFLQFLEDLGLTWVEAWHGAPDDAIYEARIRRWLRKAPDIRAAIKARDRDRCRYCGAMVSWRDRRGPQAGTYDLVDPAGACDLINVVTACRSCSARKGPHRPDQVEMRILTLADLDTNLGSDLGPPGLDLGTGPGSLVYQEQEQEQEQDLVHTPAARAAAFPRQVQVDPAWTRALALAHTVIDQDPDDKNHSSEFKARCPDHGLDPYTPGKDDRRPLYARVFEAVYAVRQLRAVRPRPGKAS